MSSCISIRRAVAIALALLGGWVSLYAQTTPTVVLVPTQSVKVVPKVIYGTDDRIDVYQDTNLEHQRFAASACGLFDSTAVTSNGDGSYSIKTEYYNYNGLPACANEPFANQRTAPWCSGFLVGPDLIATAGHCMESSSELATTKIVFGFRMQSADQETLRVDASQVYTPVELVAQQLDGGSPWRDYAVVRLDRAVTSYGAAPMNLRRAGTVTVNAPIGVIGHPWGLPQKIAFGSNTKVYKASDTNFFVTNLDTFGGNSGSPVWNATTSVLEGILVRGATDFVSNASCFNSNYVTDASAGDGSNGEEVSKALSFVSNIPERTTPWFNQIAYKGGQTMALMLTNTSASGNISVSVTTTAGDSETVTLSDPDGDKVFRGTLAVGAYPGSVTTGNNSLEGNASDTITATYGSVSSTAPLDNTIPVLSNLQLVDYTSANATIQVQTNEVCTARLQYGLYQNAPTEEVIAYDGTNGLTHTFVMTGLLPCNTYFYRLVVTDSAGNSVLANNGGLDYSFHTKVSGGFSDTFEPVQSGWTHSVASGTDNWAVRSAVNIPSPGNVYSFDPGVASVTDARLVSPTLPALDVLEFYQRYDFEKTTNGNYDGGIIEYSTNGGGTWTNLSSRILEGGYNGTVSSSYSNPLAGQQAWTGSTSNLFVKCRISLAGLTNVKVRFRFAADSDVASGAWQIDNVSVGGFNTCENAARVWEKYK
jgi:V8-like Glu-specific endopeptidase